jgi:hypothetical protein
MSICKKYYVTSSLPGIYLDGLQYTDCSGTPITITPTGVSFTELYLDGVSHSGNTFPCVTVGSIDISTIPGANIIELGGCGSSTVYTFSACGTNEIFSVSGMSSPPTDSELYLMDTGRLGNAVSAECATFFSVLTATTVYSVLGKSIENLTDLSEDCNSPVCDYNLRCLSATGPIISYYCLNGTGIYDDTYTTYSGNVYNFRSYYTGSTNSLFVFFSPTTSKWCLSTSLGGNCFMFGPSSPRSLCPDFSNFYWNLGVCVTPTPTPTINCDALEFEAIFECEVTPSPTVTSTLPTTPTPTPTPTDLTCYGIGISALLISTSPTPTPTNTVTPSPSVPLNRPYTFMGDVTFTTVNATISCPSSKQFQDCLNGIMYYTTEDVLAPDDSPLETFGIYKSTVDNISRCLAYIGINYDTIGVSTITTNEGPLGFLNLGGCVNCFSDPTPTPTLTPTITITPTITLTPTPSSILTYYVYQKCGPASPTFLIQNVAGPTTVINSIFKDTGKNECWQFKFSQQYTAPNSASLGSPYVTNYSGNYFIGPYLLDRASCVACLS